MDCSAVDQAIDLLRRRRAEWAGLALGHKAQLLRQCVAAVGRVALRQVEVALASKGWDRALEGEELLSGPLIVARNLRLLAVSLEQIARDGMPRLPRGAVSRRADGQVVVGVLPAGHYDRVLYRGITAEVWLQRGTHESEFDRVVTHPCARASTGALALVLGAGNVASIAPLDLAQKVFVEGCVCLLKMNPVNAYLKPFIEQIFAPLIEQGFVRIVDGGAELGAYLCQHEGVDQIHVTGSAATHDAIVYGVGEEGRARKRRDEPINNRPVSSELGNIGPVIVVPGQWSAAELRFQAENLATQLVNNAGFNCNAARVLVTQRDWPQREPFIEHLADVLGRLPTRPAYYPGALASYQSVLDAHPTAIRIGRSDAERLPWTLVLDLDSEARDEICFTRESFCPVLAETSLSAGMPDFLSQAAQWCNRSLWGNLSAELLVDPRTARLWATELDDAVARLHYGSVAVNHWPALSYGLGTTPWGAFPGHGRRDIQSGKGVVHNTYLLEPVEKCVLRGPFSLFPRPPWFATHRNQLAVARRMLRFELAPSPLMLPGIVIAALAG
jgi:hypothetical protein